MLLGSHVSMNGKKMLAGSAEEAHKFGESTFMIYTGAPQNTRRKPIEELNIDQGQELMQTYGLSNIVVHAPYIINIANTVKPHVFNLGVEFLQSEIERTQAIGAKDIVLHPGSHVGEGADAGINKIIEGLNEVLTNDNNVGGWQCFFPVQLPGLGGDQTGEVVQQLAASGAQRFGRG